MDSIKFLNLSPHVIRPNVLGQKPQLFPLFELQQKLEIKKRKQENKKMKYLKSLLEAVNYVFHPIQHKIAVKKLKNKKKPYTRVRVILVVEQHAFENFFEVI